MSVQLMLEPLILASDNIKSVLTHNSETYLTWRRIHFCQYRKPENKNTLHFKVRNITYTNPTRHINLSRTATDPQDDVKLKTCQNPVTVAAISHDEFIKSSGIVVILLLVDFNSIIRYLTIPANIRPPSFCTGGSVANDCRLLST